MLLSLFNLLKKLFSLLEELECSLRFGLRSLKGLLSFVIDLLEEWEEGVGVDFVLLRRQIEGILIVRSGCYVLGHLLLSQISIIPLFSPITTGARNLWDPCHSSLLRLGLLSHFVTGFLGCARWWIIANDVGLELVQLFLFAVEVLDGWLTAGLNGPRLQIHPRQPIGIIIVAITAERSLNMEFLKLRLLETCVLSATQPP